ncbi:Flp family type IVb pilin [Agromyces arachidis]|uniref:Flp family type IVb pilin n=1 Tax=Agromyces arachidis TaxID=766966 RepID=UPI004055EF52
MNKLIAKAQTRLIKRLETLQEKEDGVTSVEYALILGLVSLLIIAALVLLVQPITDFINNDIIAKL